MQKLTKKSAAQWLNRKTPVTLHEAVCLLLNLEPQGERPAKPSANYLSAENWLRETVPMEIGMTFKEAAVDQVRNFLLAHGLRGELLDVAVREFAALPASEQEIALAGLRLATARTADELQRIVESEPLRSFPDDRRAELVADLVRLLPH